VKNLLLKLLENKSSKNLAYELIDLGMPYDDENAEKLAALIRKWKSQGKVPKKYENYIKQVAEKLGIKYLDEKDEKLLKCAFVNFLKDMKISYYEKGDKNIETKEALIFLIFILILDKEFVSESIEKEWENLIELEEE